MTMQSEQKTGNKRSLARLALVQALYQMDTAGTGIDDVISEFKEFLMGKEIKGDTYAPADPGFFVNLLQGILETQLEHDPIIDETLDKAGWPLTRIDLTLRQILRAGFYELTARKDIPVKAIISEYIDVADAFFDKGDEVKIVNAVLDRLAKLRRPEEFA